MLDDYQKRKCFREHTKDIRFLLKLKKQHVGSKLMKRHFIEMYWS